MPVKDWFADWLLRHQAIHRRDDWHDPRHSPLLETWQRSFVTHGLTEEVADEATDRLAEDPPAHVSDHLPKLLAAARAIFRRNSAESRGAEPDSREAAAEASRDCADCAGQGLATRYRRHRDRDANGRPRNPEAIVAYCRCELGRWIAANHRREAPEVARRIPDLAASPWLDEFRDHPNAAAISEAGLRDLAAVYPSVRKALAEADRAEAEALYS